MFVYFYTVLCFIHHYHCCTIAFNNLVHSFAQLHCLYPCYHILLFCCIYCIHLYSLSLILCTLSDHFHDHYCCLTKFPVCVNSLRLPYSERQVGGSTVCETTLFKTSMWMIPCTAYPGAQMEPCVTDHIDCWTVAGYCTFNLYTIVN